jgi:hypothetical protein
MIEEVKHWLALRKLIRERQKTEIFYDAEYAKAKTHEEKSSVAAVHWQEVGLIDENIGFLLSQYFQRKAEMLQIPTPPFSSESGKWVDGEYTRKWRLSPEQIHKLRASVRKEQ